MCAHKDSNRLCAEGENLHFGDVCLLGLGLTGRAVVEYFLRHPSQLDSLTLYTGPLEKDSLAYLAALPERIVVVQGDELVKGSYDLAVVSPGISPQSMFYLSAAKAAREVISEPELAWRISPQNWIAVTGTNGKTTVTKLIAALLKAAGKTAWVAGNIGIPCIEIVDSRQEQDWLVAELSSYQLHATVNFAPELAVLLNITPDHLNWHGSFDNYHADKCRIIANLPANRPAIFDISLPATRAVATDFLEKGGRAICVGSAEGLVLKKKAACPESAWVDASTGRLCLALEKGNYLLLLAQDLVIQGPHNLSNALAAAAAAAWAGATAGEINAGLSSFAPLPHRFEPCGVVAGVSFINDSKATNSDAAIKALDSFADDSQQRKVVSLFGGVDKSTDLAYLAQAAKRSCRCAVCYGEAGLRFFNAFKTVIHAVHVLSFDEAFARAFALAQPGDTVLLSPACASFDEFDSFEARGTHFKTLVAQLGSEQS